MIDYVFRYDPSQPHLHRQPANAEEARQELIEGNRTFWEWTTTCRAANPSVGGAYIVPCRGVDATVPPSGDEYPVQKPFAAVLGC